MKPLANPRKTLKENMREPAPLYVWVMMFAFLAVAALISILYLYYLRKY
jgi:hypothetical protein